MKDKLHITAIFIAYKAASTLEKFYAEFPKELFDDIILVDDASHDGTYELSQTLGITSFQNPKNLGYGGNVKRAVSLALERGADVIVDLHPDGEYKPNAIAPSLQKIREGAGVVLGNRFADGYDPLKSGMFVWKYIPIVILSKLAKWILRIDSDDAHQGFRVYPRALFEKVPYEKNSNDYLFSFEIIAQAAFHGFKITQVPVETVYSGEKRGASLKSSIKYSIGVLNVLLLFVVAKLGIVTHLFHRRVLTTS